LAYENVRSLVGAGRRLPLCTCGGGDRARRSLDPARRLIRARRCRAATMVPPRLELRAHATELSCQTSPGPSRSEEAGEDARGLRARRRDRRGMEAEALERASLFGELLRLPDASLHLAVIGVRKPRARRAARASRPPDDGREATTFLGQPWGMVTGTASSSPPRICRSSSGYRERGREARRRDDPDHDARQIEERSRSSSRTLVIRGIERQDPLPGVGRNGGWTRLLPRGELE